MQVETDKMQSKIIHAYLDRSINGKSMTHHISNLRKNRTDEATAVVDKSSSK